MLDHPKSHHRNLQASKHLPASFFRSFVANLRIRIASQSQQTLAQGIQDRLAPHQANGHVVHLKRIPWFKWPRQIQDWVRRIDREGQVDVIWPVMDEASIQAGKHNIGYAWVMCESKYAASRLAREVNHYSRRNTCFGRTLEASDAKHPRVSVQVFSGTANKHFSVARISTETSYD